jgi:hypothetical protein
MENVKLGKSVRLNGNEAIVTGWRPDSNDVFSIIADDVMRCFAVADANGVTVVRDNHGFYFHKIDGEWVQRIGR